MSRKGNHKDGGKGSRLYRNVSNSPAKLHGVITTICFILATVIYRDFVHLKHCSGLPFCGPKIESVTSGIHAAVVAASGVTVEVTAFGTKVGGGVCALFVWEVCGHNMVDPVNGSEADI